MRVPSEPSKPPRDAPGLLRGKRLPAACSYPHCSLLACGGCWHSQPAWLGANLARAAPPACLQIQGDREQALARAMEAGFIDDYTGWRK